MTSAMTPDEFRATLERLHVTQVQAGLLIDCVPNTVSKFANGGLPVPRYVVHILVACELHPNLVPRFLVE